jgi:glycine C-acetyltransferase
MSGDLGKLDEIAALKKEFKFRLLVDDAHGFGTMGLTGAGVGEYLGVQDEIDVYFGTFAKAMASIGAFVAAKKEVIYFLAYNLRSQIFAKSLPMPLVEGALKRLDLIRKHPEFRDKLWTIANALQKGLKERGFNIGNTQSPVTPIFFSGEASEATNLAFDLRENYNIFCSVVGYPVVPKGVIIIRIIPTAVHTLEDVSILLLMHSHRSRKICSLANMLPGKWLFTAKPLYISKQKRQAREELVFFLFVGFLKNKLYLKFHFISFPVQECIYATRGLNHLQEKNHSCVLLYKCNL